MQQKCEDCAIQSESIVSLLTDNRLHTRLGTWKIDFRVRFLEKNIELFPVARDKVPSIILIFKFPNHGT